MCDDQDAVAALRGARCYGGRAACYISDQHPRRERVFDFRSAFVFVAYKACNEGQSPKVH